MSEWKECLLSELGIIVGGATPSTRDEANYGGDIGWITPKDLAGYGDRYIGRGERNITQKGFGSCSTVLLPKGAVLFSSRAPIGYVAIATNPLCTNQGFKSIIPNEKLDTLFGYYLLKHNKTKIENLGSGTTFKEVSAAVMRGVQVSIPTLTTQRKIAAVLGALDDKIELNRKMNANLEAMAQALFKSWFVDFEPFGGKMPEGWRMRSVSDLADFVGGYAYTSSELQPSQCAMATIKNFERNGGFKLEGYKEVVPSSKLKESQRVDLFDILVAHTDLTQNAEVIGNAEMILSKSGYESLIMSTDLVKVLPKEGVSRFVLAGVLKYAGFKAHALGYVNGTTVLHMSKKALPEYELPYPDDVSVLRPLAEAAESFCRKIAINLELSRTLAQLRDALLPKLMSGELDVEAVKVEV